MVLQLFSNKIAVTLVAPILFALFMVQSSETTEINDRICISDANKKFVTLAKNIYASETFYTKINNLKCIYLDLRDGKLDDSVPCDTEPTTFLDLNRTNLVKIKDLNKKEDIALERYSQLMSDFVPSLIQIESFEANVTSRRTYVNMVKSVTEHLEYIRNNTKSVAKSYGHCYKSTPNNKTRIIPTVVLPFYEPRLIGVGISKEELAGALFKQLRTVFLQIKEELFQRKKCLT